MGTAVVADSRYDPRCDTVRGRTLRVVGHQHQRAAALADRAIVLAAGRVVFERRDGEGGAEALERAVLAASDVAS